LRPKRAKKLEGLFTRFHCKGFIKMSLQAFPSWPTITDSNKKTTKRRHLRPLNRKMRNPFITDSNYRTASKGQGIRDPLRSHSNKQVF
jgi:hypothetical protein